MLRICTRKVIFDSHKKFGFTFVRKFSSVFEEHKVKVRGFDINYVKKGTGAHPVLLMPGVMGTGWSHFKPQLNNLDGSKFTIVAWDPPGYGKSRPPDRTFPQDWLERDASIAHDLMKILGFEKFSIVGWCNGGITALVLAANHSESIQKMVVSGASSYVTLSEYRHFSIVKTPEGMGSRLSRQVLEIYDEAYAKAALLSWLDRVIIYCERYDGDMCKDRVPKIRCPSLIIHGTKDSIIDVEHAYFLKSHIPDSRLSIFKGAEHNVHLEYYEKFNDLITTFLLE